MLDKIKTFLDKWGRVFLDVAMATVTYIALYKEGIFPKLDMWSWLVYFILIGAFIKTDFEFERIQDPEKIMNRVFEILSRLEPQNASAIGFSGQMHGIVYTDKNGNAHTLYGNLVTETL